MPNYSLYVGGGLVYVPAISIVTHRFSTQPALALGIAATGSAIGGIIWPIAFRRLLAPIGFAWANRVFTLLVLVLAVVSYCALTGSHRRTPKLFSHRPKDESEYGSESDAPVLTSKQRTILAVLKGRAYQFLCIGIFFTLLGYWVPLFYLVPYASLSLGISSTNASDLLSILNAASLFGRVLPAAVGHKLGPANILLAGATVLGVLIFSWASIETIAGITVWSIFLGYVLLPYTPFIMASLSLTDESAPLIGSPPEALSQSRTLWRHDFLIIQTWGSV